jgi:replicative DNA helicase
LIFDPNQIPKVLKILPEPGMFSAARHVLIYQTILWLHREGIPVNFARLRDELASDGLLDLVGGPKYLITLVESLPNAENAPEYARSVFDLFFERLT